MRRIIDQINVSITTNRTCTLRCSHCYIAPHLFKDRTQMSEETYRLVFDKIERLKAIDTNLREIEWEVIGGETTMMPFEWWARQLPWSLERIGEFNAQLRTPGALNFLTNLIYSDQRYTGLLNDYGHHDNFCLYTSWEPDTQRFGKRNQLFERFYQTLCAIDARQKTLDIILTKEVIAIGAERILDMFLPAGITDFSMKMISPYGSGKAFFESNMEEFHKMTDFFKEMHRLKPAHVTFTPEEEMFSSLTKGTSFQCNGNFKYDLSIEPDGVCHFNANQTANEAALGFRQVRLEDPDWEYKICFENKVEENNKLTLAHPECDQCEYMRFCNAGWYHYKVAQPEVIDQYRAKECSGYKQFWDFSKEFLKYRPYDMSNSLHRIELTRIMRLRNVQPEQIPITRESELVKGYNNYFKQIKALKSICVDRQSLYGKTLLQRLWFYSDLGVTVKIEEEMLDRCPDKDQVHMHVAYRNLRNVQLTTRQMEALVNSPTQLGRRARTFLGVLNGFESGLRSVGEISRPLFIDSRNEDFFRFLIQNNARVMVAAESLPPGEKESIYLGQLLNNLGMEQLMRGDS